MAVWFTKIRRDSQKTGDTTDETLFLDVQTIRATEVSGSSSRVSFKNSRGDLGVITDGDYLQPDDDIEIHVSTAPISMGTSVPIFSGDISEINYNSDSGKCNVNCKIVDRTMVLFDTPWNQVYRSSYKTGASTAVSGNTLTVSGAGYTVDEFEGMTFEPTDGTADNKLYKVVSNTDEIITVTADTVLQSDGFNIGDNFVIGSSIPYIIKNMSGHVTKGKLNFDNVETTMSGYDKDDSTSAKSGVFPRADYTINWKTIAQAISELSQPDKTDINRGYVWWIDVEDDLYWKYPEVETSTVIEYGKDNIISEQSSLSYDNAYNVVIYCAGKDKNGNNYWNYKMNESAPVSRNRIKIKDFSETAYEIRDGLIKTNTKTKLDGAAAAGDAEVDIDVGSSYGSSGTNYALIGSWDGDHEIIKYESRTNNKLESVTRAQQNTTAKSWADDTPIGDVTAYVAMNNDDFRTELKKVADAKSMSFMTGVGKGKWQIQISYKGLTAHNIGDFVKYRHLKNGHNDRQVRIIDKRVITQKGNYFTYLTLEEDDSETQKL